MAIEVIHEAVLTHLLNYSEPLRFTLRTRNRRNDERLSKGYWFTGNDSYLVFSFWEGSDWRNKTSNIFFGINAEGRCWLEVVDNDNTEKARFFEEIAPIIGLQRFNNKERFQWKKSYSNDNNYLASLDEFLKTDKKIIDASLIYKKELFLPISADTFQSNLENVLVWRKKIYDKHQDIQTYNKNTKYPIRLQKVIFDNIGHFKHIEINLNQQVTCLIGENGSGKTTILRGIALGLAGIGDKADNSIIDPSLEPIQKMLRINKVQGNEEIFAATGQITVVYNDIQEKNFINFEFIKGESVDNQGEIKRDYNDINDLGSDATTTENSNEFRNLILGFSQVKSSDNPKNNSNVEESPFGRISEVASLIYGHPDNALDNFKNWIVQLWDISYSVEQRDIRLDVLQQIFSVIAKIVGDSFELMPMKANQKEVFIKTEDAPNGIPIRLISQGYNNVIGWVGYFMQRLWQVTPEEKKIDFKQTPAICLIDEIDTYLHPKWEKTILSVLADEFPNTQFVVTTHSPMVIANLKDNYKIYRISKHNGLMMAFEHNNKDFNPYGAESSRILRMLMMPLVNERPENVQTIIYKYNNAILENNFEAAYTFEEQLKELIDHNDPVLIEGEASIEARKMIQEL